MEPTFDQELHETLVDRIIDHATMTRRLAELFDVVASCEREAILDDRIILASRIGGGR